MHELLQKFVWYARNNCTIKCIEKDTFPHDWSINFVYSYYMIIMLLNHYAKSIPKRNLFYCVEKT